MIDVVWLEPKPLDHFMLMDIFGDMWNAVGSLEYNIVDSFDKTQSEGVVAVVPGAGQDASEINEQLKKYKWVLLIVVSDEENLFELNKIQHSNIKYWIQTPRADVNYKDARYFGVGYAFSKKYRDKLEQEYLTKPNDVFISGQNTHSRRNLIFKKLHEYKDKNPSKNIEIFETAGFTQGMSPGKYYKNMALAKVVPCPSGVVSPDSFRLYEALEFGCIPIADDVSPAVDYNSNGYWKKIFPDAPFSIISDNSIAKPIDTALDSFIWRSNFIFSWWIKQKRQYVYNLVDDIRALADMPVHVETLKEKLTVVIPVSPWKSHPDTFILETTIESVRKHLPDCEIIVTFDGVRSEQQDRFNNYQDFVRRMLWKINTEYKNVLPLVFEKHSHQVKMMREALKCVRTESVIYVEGDSPLYADRDIDWNEITGLISRGDAEIIRLYNKDEIPDVHEYLMYHEHDLENNGDKYIATSQWSQQPHIVRADTYRQIINEYFTENSICFIEDKFYYIIVNDAQNGKWDKWRMFIYIPNDKKPRSYHLDGRAGGEKYDDKQVW